MSLCAQPPCQDADSNSRYIYSAAPSIGSPRSGSTHIVTKHTSIAEQLQRGEHIVGRNVPNIVIYGETGVGKSSIINLIAGQKLADTSNDAFGCTFKHQRYIVEPNGMACALWDTTGLDEGSDGTIPGPAAQAENNLRLLLQELANSVGIHLLVYCIRASRFRNAHQRNYDLFYVTVCRKKVPVALVVTGLERQQGEMDTWWAANEAVLRRYGMRFDAHACVTTLDMDDHIIQQRRNHSQRLLQELVVRYSTLPAFKTEPSFMSSVLPMFRTVLHKTMAAGRTKKSTTTRTRVITCDMTSASNPSIPVLIKSSSDITLVGCTRSAFTIPFLRNRNPHNANLERIIQKGGTFTSVCRTSDPHQGPVKLIHPTPTLAIPAAKRAEQDVASGSSMINKGKGSASETETGHEE